MSLLRFMTSHICLLTAFMLASAAWGLAQNPEDFFVSPTVVTQGECYDVWVTPLSPWMSLDIQYTFNDGPLQTVYGWPVMDETGVARNICSNDATVPGDYTFVNIRNSLEQSWLYVGRTVTVLPPVQDPQGFSVSPAVLVQGECYDAWVTPLASGMHLDFQYTLNGSPLQTVYDWPVMDETGVARNICTNFTTVPGTYVFVNIKNSQSSNWVNVNTPITVLRQPTALHYDPPVAYAGTDFYSGTVTNGESMVVHIRFNWNGYQDLIGGFGTDESGRFVTGPIDHYSATGFFLVTGIQNEAAQPTNWVNVNVPYYVLPPQPSDFHLDKSSIRDDATNGDQTYHMLAGNGADILIDFKYSIDDGPVQEVYGWPWLYPDSPGSWNGHSGDISASACTIPGLYRFLGVRNSMNSAWVPVSPPTELTVIGPGAPLISMVSPASGRPGQSITSNIDGQKFCGVTLTTDYPGLSVSLTVSTETQVTAVFNIASSASPGTANVTLHASGGSADFQFIVRPPPAPPPLSREYIYLGERVLAVESP